MQRKHCHDDESRFQNAKMETEQRKKSPFNQTTINRRQKGPETKKGANN